MSNSLVLYGSLSILLTVLGGVIPLLRHWKEDHLHSFVSVSAGLLLSTAFLHLMPETFERVEPQVGSALILLSFLVLFVIEKFVMLHPCEESHCDYHTIGIASYVGMVIHTFFDGVALGTSFLVPGLSGIVFLAIMMHKVPSSFSLACILKKAKWPTPRIFLFLALFGSLIPLGSSLSSYFLSQMGDKVIGYGLALSLGTFIYISTSDFLPEVHRRDSHRIRSLLSFLAGIFLGCLSAFFHHGIH